MSNFKNKLFFLETMSLDLAIREAVGHWNRDADNWTNGYHPLLTVRSDALDRRRQDLIAALEPFKYLSSASHLLDVGSGSGGICAYMGEIDPHFVIAMDAAYEMLRRNPSRRKVLANANQRFPFADNSFDAVTQFFVNRYLLDPFQNARELGRVTKKGGVILVMDMIHLAHRYAIRDFNSSQVKSALESECSAVYITPVSPAFSDSESSYHCGPIHLVIGIK